MRRIIWLVLLLFLTREAQPIEIKSISVSEVDRLFGYGADHADERQALELVERALTDAPTDYELLWRAARSYYYVGEGAAAKDRLKYYELGIEVGHRTVATNPESVEGHFWLAANYGGYCREKGGLTAFRTIKRVRAGMETVLQLNDGYEEASAYLALGEIDRQLPRLFGGNLKRSIAYLERGLNIAPTSSEIKCALAEAYLKANRKVEARRQLEELLQLPLIARVNENRRAQEKARRLLANLDKK